MRMLCFIGAAGAGKSTVVKRLAVDRRARRLKPFTTRRPRSDEDDEYYFLQGPPHNADTAWKITRKSDIYGMHNSELANVAFEEVALTIFDPLKLGVFDEWRQENRHLNAYVVALDTIGCATEQKARLAGDTARCQSDDEITQIKKTLEGADIILRGDEEVVYQASRAIFDLFFASGSVITQDVVGPLLASKTLLLHADLNNVQAASYDLRVGDEIWCRGSFYDLYKDDDFEIPPYSYAIVKTLERAALPSFFIGEFDIKVGHFLSGILLSNGPQVDPGYKGDLFCMLFNGSSTSRSIRHGDHFATIHFLHTCGRVPAYTGRYTVRDRLRSALPVEAIRGPGGAIFSKIEADIDAAKTQLRKEMPRDRSNFFLSILTVIFGGIVAILIWIGQDARNAAELARDAATAAREAANETSRLSAPSAASEGSHLRLPWSPAIRPSPEFELREPPSSPEPARGATNDTPASNEDVELPSGLE